MPPHAGLRSTLLILAAAGLVCLPACRSTVPVYVWHPARVTTPPEAKIALAPVAGDQGLARRIEQALLAQRPAARQDVALFTADQLLAASPVRLASTAPLTSDLAALQAARAAGADVLLHGEILMADIELDPKDSPQPSDNQNMNAVFFQRLGKSSEQEYPDYSLLLSWHVLDVPTGKTLGSHAFTLHSRDALHEYPDLGMLGDQPADLLVAASARETWKTLAPVVTQEKVRLAVPWLQLGSWRVRRGVRAAKQGNWELAEHHWETASKRFWFNPAAHHNLAIARVAREDFEGAKAEIVKATGPLSLRLPSETLFWIDQNHRRYHQAHQLGKPATGWAYPDPNEVLPTINYAEPIDLNTLPWWTAIPGLGPH